MADFPNLSFESGEEKIPRKAWLKLAVLVVIITAPIITAVLVYGRTECADQKCFVDRANSCLPSTYSNGLGNLFFLYEIKDGCSLQKTVIAVDSKEPQEVVNLFNGRSMICKYTQAAFSTDYLTKITGKLESCVGELKTILSAVGS
ncbi:MAG: hypothetical protein HY512_02450 [Candidatus Aenigmarchaeota archaeon]|nr:hypothetical protein [Candidatus Aenigmarchaeota archaeon]